jgi:5-methylcytosine-specific restriction endonuclease McrA
MLTARQFWRKFKACLAGEINEFTPYVRPTRGRPDSHVWKRLRTTVFQRDDYTCQYCFERGGKLECDHIVPVSRGGNDELSNLATACFRCNRSKRDKLLSEWTR